MKIIILMLVFSVGTAFAGNEKKEYKTVMTIFETHYNAGDFKAVFELYSDKMQLKTTKDKTHQIFSGYKMELGNIVESQFIKYKFATTALYETSFEKGVRIIELSLDKEFQIKSLHFKARKDDKSKIKKVVDKQVVDGSGINKKQSDLIFKHSKMFPENTQVSIAMIDNGTVKYYGVKRTNNEIVTIDSHSNIFEIGSISKVFTATLLANFVLSKQLNLDDNIGDYIEIALKDGAKITFKELSSHHSGLARMPTNFDSAIQDWSNPYQYYDVKKLEEYLKNELALLDKKYQYSNLGAGTLGYVLTQIGNESYEGLLQSYIALKYEMYNTTTKRNKIQNKLVKGLNDKGEEVSNWDMAALVGAGGILSNVEDLAKFVLAQFNSENTELALTRVKTFEASLGMDIGLGWHLIKQGSEKHIYWHNGGTGGYTSSMAFDPKIEDAIIILSNVSAFNEHMGHIDGLSFALMKTLETN